MCECRVRVLFHVLFLESANCDSSQLGDVRVVNSNVTGSNTLEQCRHPPNSGNSTTKWLMVCGYGWDCREATVACREFLDIDNPSKQRISVVIHLIFTYTFCSSGAIPSTSYHYYHYDYNSFNLVHYTCSGIEESLTNCSSHIDHCHSIAHVICIAPRGIHYAP